MTEPDQTLLPNKRQWARIRHALSLTLKLDNGWSYEGSSLDASEGGLFLVTDSPQSKDLLGLQGQIIVQQSHNSFEIACLVTRVTEDGLGIEFRENAPAFGIFLSNDLSLSLLSRINTLFASSLDIEDTIQTAVNSIQDFMQAEAASLFLIQPDQKTIICHSCVGPVNIKGMRLSIHEGIVGRTIRNGKDVIIENVNEDPDFAVKVDIATGFKTQSILCAPMRVGDKNIGALQVINKKSAQNFIAHDRIVLSALASAAAMAIHNARQVAALMEKEYRFQNELSNQLDERTKELQLRNQELQAAKETAEEASALKDKFVSLVSHDLRGPLGAISGLVELIYRSTNPPLSDRHKSTLKEVLRSADDLQSVVKELLDISRLQTGKIKPQLKFLDAHYVIEEVFARLHISADEKHIRLINNVHANSRIYADKALISQVLQNLISNALKFSWPDNEIHVFLKKDNNITIAVQDFGTGIDLTTQDKLFRLEEKVSTPGTSGETGIGFGLPLSHNIMLAHDGDLYVESAPEKGSTFFMQLPDAKPTALIIDDQKLIRDMFTGCLEQLDIDIHCAANGQEALSLLHDGLKPDLILCDINMPIMDGFEFLKHIRHDKTLKNTPVIVITGDDNIKTREKAIGLGAIDFTVKPISPPDLIPRVKRIIG
jgi:signal transduction histidine kinase/CheY-like chemotaxis protein